MIVIYKRKYMNIELVKMFFYNEWKGFSNNKKEEKEQKKKKTFGKRNYQKWVLV